MKNAIKILLLIMVTLFANHLFAQTTLGLRGGINVATFNENPFQDLTPSMDHKYIVGGDVAVFATIGVADVFSIQPELHWIQKGMKTTTTLDNNDELKLEYRYNYLELPVLARFDVGSEFLKFNFFVGPSVGYALNKKYIGENMIYANGHPGNLTDFDEEIEWDTEYGDDGVKDNRFDISGVFGLGVTYNTGDVELLLDTRYNLDFNDFINYENTPDPEPDKYYNRGFTFTIGVAFPVGR